MNRKRLSRSRPHVLGLESSVDGDEIAVDGGAESCDGTNGNDGDQADEQTVFDEGRALFVFSKTSKQITHEKKILFRVDEDDWLSIACPVSGIGVTRIYPESKEYILNEWKMSVKYEILR